MESKRKTPRHGTLFIGVFAACLILEREKGEGCTKSNSKLYPPLVSVSLVILAEFASKAQSLQHQAALADANAQARNLQKLFQGVAPAALPGCGNQRAPVTAAALLEVEGSRNLACFGHGPVCRLQSSRSQSESNTKGSGK